MRSSVAVDNLILWHAAGILFLAWLIAAAVSVEGVLAEPSHASSASCASRPASLPVALILRGPASPCVCPNPHASLGLSLPHHEHPD
jgi:hypothetical protein